MKTAVGCLGIEPREVVIALADGHCDCRDIRSAQVSMKGGKPEINIRCSIGVESRLLLDEENASLCDTNQLMLRGQKKCVYSESYELHKYTMSGKCILLTFWPWNWTFK